MQSTGAERFEAAAMPHLNAVFQAALRLTESRVAAEEVVKDVYDHAWKAFNRGQEWNDFRLGLFKILMRRARIHFRSGWDLESLDESWERETATYSHEQVMSALARVPRDLRAVLVLVDGQGFSYEETAAILGVSREAITDCVAFARKQLRTVVGIAPTFGAKRAELGSAAPAKAGAYESRRIPPE